MVQFIEKHRRLLRAYCLIARILGWLLILGGAFWVSAIVKKSEEMQNEVFFLYLGSSLTLDFVYDFVIPGFLAFVAADLLNYLLRPDAKPRISLRIIDKLCYIYAIFVIYKAFSVHFWLMHAKFPEITVPSETDYILLVQPLLLPTVLKVLLLIAVGMILHRLLPVIEESKTLVLKEIEK